MYKIEPEHISKVSAPDGGEDTGMIDEWCMVKENTMRMTMMTTTTTCSMTAECLALPKQQMQRTESQAGPATKPPVAKQAAKPDANTAKSVLQGSGGKLAQGVEARQL